MVEVTERDLKVLKLLARYGCVNKKTIYSIYEDENTKIGAQYKYKRIQKLKREHYLVLGEGYFILGFNAKKYLEENNIKINYKTMKDEQKIFLARIADTINYLEKYFEVENRGSIYQQEEYQNQKDYIKRYYGRTKLQHNGKYVYIYRITKGMIVAKLKQIKVEISNITKNAIILADTEAEIKKYKRIKIDSDASTEILIPFKEYGLKMLKYFIDGELEDERLGELIPNVNLVDGKMYTADENNLLVNLTTNDLVTERFIDAYKKITDKISILCFDWQAENYGEQYKDLQIISIKSYE